MEELANSSSTTTIMLNPIDAARATPYWFGIDPVSGF